MSARTQGTSRLTARIREVRAARAQRRKLNRLVFSYKRCECGALYAYLSGDSQRAWDCSDILLGLAVPMGQPGSVRHGDTMPFIFWKVKEAPHAWGVENRIKREESSDAIQG
jgi:hypothetical protein